jgi:hypothetical protein
MIEDRTKLILELIEVACYLKELEKQKQIDIFVMVLLLLTEKIKEQHDNRTAHSAE